MGVGERRLPHFSPSTVPQTIFPRIKTDAHSRRLSNLYFFMEDLFLKVGSKIFFLILR